MTNVILPFVREIFADVEKSPAFLRAIAQVKGGAGRTRVSGLTPTGKALFYSLLQRATSRPLIVVVSDNRAMDELLPVVRSLAELTGAVAPESVIGLPAYDVLPFENQSPHPEIQEARATALWKIATGAANVVITPFSAASMRLRDASFYADLARVVRRGEMIDPERLVEHLRLAGYNQVDVVEMPGEFAHRGGLLDVYPPESDRPVRIELFGDEVESMRKFDPAHAALGGRDGRSGAAAADRNSGGRRHAGGHQCAALAVIASQATTTSIEQAVRSTGVSVFPGWELYAPVAGAEQSFFDLLPGATVVLDEPDALTEVARRLVDEADRGARAQPHRQSGAARGSVPQSRAVAASAATVADSRSRAARHRRLRRRPSTSSCRRSRPRASTARWRP